MSGLSRRGSCLSRGGDSKIRSLSIAPPLNRGEPWYFLSNSSDYPVYYENVRYPTAEHLFQCLKFIPHAPEIASKVRKAPTALDAVKIARGNAISVKKGWIKDGINVREVSETSRTTLDRRWNEWERLSGDVDVMSWLLELINDE